MNNPTIIRQTDILMWSVLGMFLGMRICVLVLFNITATETGADIEAVHTAYEASPIFRYSLSLERLGYVLQFIIVPAVGFATYFIFRRKVLMDNYPVDTLQFNVLFLFFLILFNFVNDCSSLLGRVL